MHKCCRCGKDADGGQFNFEWGTYDFCGRCMTDLIKNMYEFIRDGRAKYLNEK